MRRIGIMGGTFDPVHMGHLMLAQWALEELSLDEVWLIPTGMSYMKASRQILPGEERLRMVQLAVMDNDRFRCLDLEVRRMGYTYSYETLEELRSRYPADEFYFILGADCLFSLEDWKAPERILGCCTLVAAVRGETDLSKMESKKGNLCRSSIPRGKSSSFPSSACRFPPRRSGSASALGKASDTWYLTGYWNISGKRDFI